MGVYNCQLVLCISWSPPLNTTKAHNEAWMTVSGSVLSDFCIIEERWVANTFSFHTMSNHELLFILPLKAVLAKLPCSLILFKMRPDKTSSWLKHNWDLHGRLPPLCHIPKVDYMHQTKTMQSIQSDHIILICWQENLGFLLFIKNLRSILKHRIYF